MGPGPLSQVLRQFAQPDFPGLMVGLDPADDAAVYRVADDLAIIHTVDFFTPVCDDPYTWGQIAAANGLSDVYAMGGTPVLALNIACFPDCLTDQLIEVLRGGADKVAEAGAVIAGGHTVIDNEPKYGLCVVGTVHPDRLITSAGAQPGDILVLTKPLGTGIIISAMRGNAAPDSVRDNALAIMAVLNRQAAQALSAACATACTDITGFGFVGHASNLARSSGVTLVIDAGKVPMLDGAYDLAADGIVPAGAHANRQHFGCGVDWNATDPVLTDILCDPQTSGGLLISLPERGLEAFGTGVSGRDGELCTVIGQATPRQDRLIVFR